jgi:hypothetical protein
VTDIIIANCSQILRLNILRILKVRSYIFNQSCMWRGVFFITKCIVSQVQILANKVCNTTVIILKHTHYQYCSVTQCPFCRFHSVL